jgi:hypothetical protein
MITLLNNLLARFQLHLIKMSFLHYHIYGTRTILSETFFKSVYINVLSLIKVVFLIRKSV